jgi:hypothetical protein
MNFKYFCPLYEPEPLDVEAKCAFLEQYADPKTK